MLESLRGRVKEADADRLLRFARAGAPLAARAVAATSKDDGDVRGHADRLVGHWRRELAPLTAVPGLGGRVASTVVEVLAATAQGLLVLSLADLQGVDDETERVRLVALLALGVRPPHSWSAETSTDPGDVDEGGTDPDDGDDAETAAWRLALRRTSSGVVSAAREMWAVRRLATKRRSGGRLWHQAVAMLPVVGVAGAVLGERHAITEIAERAYVELGIPSAT